MRSHAARAHTHTHAAHLHSHTLTIRLCNGRGGARSDRGRQYVVQCAIGYRGYRRSNQTIALLNWRCCRRSGSLFRKGFSVLLLCCCLALDAVAAAAGLSLVCACISCLCINRGAVIRATTLHWAENIGRRLNNGTAPGHESSLPVTRTVARLGSAGLGGDSARAPQQPPQTPALRQGLLQQRHARRAQGDRQTVAGVNISSGFRYPPLYAIDTSR